MGHLWPPGRTFPMPVLMSARPVLVTALTKYYYCDATIVRLMTFGGTNNALFVFFCGFWGLSAAVVACSGRSSESAANWLKKQKH